MVMAMMLAVYVQLRGLAKLPEALSKACSQLRFNNCRLDGHTICHFVSLLLGPCTADNL